MDDFVRTRAITSWQAEPAALGRMGGRGGAASRAPGAVNGVVTGGTERLRYGATLAQLSASEMLTLLRVRRLPRDGGGSFIADTAPEATAAELRAVSAVLYRER